MIERITLFLPQTSRTVLEVWIPCSVENSVMQYALLPILSEAVTSYQF